MGVGVGLGDGAVGGPAGVADAQVRFIFGPEHDAGHLFHSPGFFKNADTVLFPKSQAGRIVTTVFEAL